ncbi:MAG: response regulator transcription factor [Anaerolineaceae bacterium]|nr:response regulator transcription factor [Anaerolineaceae bacterium]
MTLKFAPHIRVIVADRDPFTRHMFRLIFQAYDEFALVGLAGTGIELLRLYQMQRPDVVLVDLGLPRFNGIKAARFLRTIYPRIQIIGIARGHVSDYARAQFMDTGAYACLSNVGSIHDLITTVNESIS